MEFDVVPADAGDGAEPVTASCAFGVEDLILVIDSETGDLAVMPESPELPPCEWLAG